MTGCRTYGIPVLIVLCLRVPTQFLFYKRVDQQFFYTLLSKCLLLSKHRVCQISNKKTLNSQPFQLLSLSRWCKNVINIFWLSSELRAEIMDFSIKTPKSENIVGCHVTCVNFLLNSHFFLLMTGFRLFNKDQFCYETII